MKQFWNERYGETPYAYGKEPNAFFADWLKGKTPGKILFPADGEGRNSVYAATQGWDSHAFDYSAEGKIKAEALAKQMNVGIHYEVADVEEVELQANEFDVVVMTYVHLPPPLRAGAWAKLYHCLKPGGMLVCEWFSKEQLGKTSGGPPVIGMLYNEAELRSEFAAFDIQSIEATETTLREGPYHDGHASVIRLIAQKPAS